MLTNDDDFYKVNSILDKRINRSNNTNVDVEEFYIRWEGYGSEDDSWQSEENCVQYCYKLICNLEASRFEKIKKLNPKIIGFKMTFSDRIKLLVEWQATPVKTSREFFYSSVLISHDPDMLIKYYENNTTIPDQDNELTHFHNSLTKTAEIDKHAKPSKIIGIAHCRGETLYLVSWRKLEEATFVDYDFIKSNFPRLLVKFYEEHLFPRKT